MVKSGTANNASPGAERKLKNGILDRWRVVLAERGGADAVRTPLGGTVRTFSDLEAEANEIAEHLSKLAPGAVIGLQAPNVPSWPAMLLGIWKAGGCALLLDHTLGSATRDSVELLCGASGRLEMADGKVREVLLERPPADFGPVPPDLIKLTSGTSGTPRAILFTAAQLEADCEQVCEAMGLCGTDINYGVVAFSHSYGFSNLITPLICRGISLVAAQDALPRALLEGISVSGATVLPAVPAMFHALSGVDGALPGLRLCISAGAPLRPETGSAFRKRFGKKIHTFYGASECGGIAYDASNEEVSTPGFVGRPMPGVELDPLEGRGGQVRVRSAAVGLRYFPVESEELSDAGFMPSDSIAMEEAGLRITGRLSDVINVGGKKASPQEIESVLLSHPSVLEAVVFGLGSQSRTEAVCACLVSSVKIDHAALRAYCSERLAPWQVPRSIIQLDEIPVNARGKVSRAELAERFSNLA